MLLYTKIKFELNYTTFYKTLVKVEYENDFNLFTFCLLLL